MASKYYIVYPGGNRAELAVVGIVDALDYELNDYDVASRCSFVDEASASQYAARLASQYNLRLSKSGPAYLD